LKTGGGDFVSLPPFS